MKAKQWATALALTALSASLLAVQGTAEEKPDLSLPYQPTRAEWLQMTTHQIVSEALSKVGTRIHYRVLVDKGGILVMMTPPVGQFKPNTAEAKLLAQGLREKINLRLDSYDWAKGLDLTIFSFDSMTSQPVGLP